MYLIMSGTRGSQTACGLRQIGVCIDSQYVPITTVGDDTDLSTPRPESASILRSGTTSAQRGPVRGNTSEASVGE